MKNKMKIVIIVIISILLFMGILFIPTNNTNKKQDQTNLVCNEIIASEKAEENFVILIKSNLNMNGDINDAITGFLEKYNNINIYNIDINDLKKECIKNHVEKTGYYEELKENKITTIIGYKKGEVAGVVQNPSSLNTIENHFEKLGIIEIQEKVEKGLTYKEYKENINSNEEYFISVITNEDLRETVIENTEKLFPNIKHDVINLTSDEGSKIVDDIKSKIKIEEIYPHIFYFKNGEIIFEHTGGFISELEEFKQKIEQ